ncbi:MAG TPA: hypothetical protein VFZ66_03540 [Herpetosiphonaceae bacterium]
MLDVPAAQRGPRASLLTLIHPRKRTRPLLLALILGFLLGGLLMVSAGMPLSGATLLTLGLLAYPAFLKWRDDVARWGAPLTALSMLLALQGFHTFEHIAQYVQFHYLGWPGKAAGGLLAAANVETVHFFWNWAVCLSVLWILNQGLRHPWGYVMFAWSFAHSLEHTYLFITYLDAVLVLWSQDVSLAFAQGLPGILGRHGWLETAGWQYAPTALLCQLAPPLVSAPRISVHFWWNMGEVALLLPFAHAVMRRHGAQMANAGTP